MKTKTIALLAIIASGLSVAAQTLENVTYTKESMSFSNYAGFTLNNVTFEATNVSGSIFSGAEMNNVAFHVRHDTGLQVAI